MPYKPTLRLETKHSVWLFDEDCFYYCRMPKSEAPAQHQNVPYTTAWHPYDRLVVGGVNPYTGRKPFTVETPVGPLSSEAVVCDPWWDLDGDGNIVKIGDPPLGWEETPVDVAPPSEQVKESV